MPPLRVLAAVHILSRVHTAVSLRVRSVTLLRTMSSKTSPLVTAAWLKDAIEKKEPNLQVLDASWHMPAFKRDAPKEYAEKHIPTAQFWQIGAYKSELATPEKFGEDLGKLGVGNDTHVVVYDSNPTFGLFSAPRAWWLLRYYGHENVSILDGGFPKWEEAGYETTDVVDKVEPKTFKANPNAALLRTMADIDANVENKKFTVIDGRPAGRFLGTSPEPRPDIKPGHVKGAISIPFTVLIDPKTKMMKSADDIYQVFKNSAGSLEDTPIVAMCGSGVTACFPVLGAYICGHEAVPLYDGSWTEYFLKGKPENMVLPGEQ